MDVTNAWASWIQALVCIGIWRDNPHGTDNGCSTRQGTGGSGAIAGGRIGPNCCSKLSQADELCPSEETLQRETSLGKGCE